MTIPSNGEDRVDRRAADLLPEERATGSADPEAQAEAILADSDEREHDGAAPDSFLEHRTSAETVDPGSQPDEGAASRGETTR
jgi:hypothetical protein